MKSSFRSYDNFGRNEFSYIVSGKVNYKIKTILKSLTHYSIISPIKNQNQNELRKQTVYSFSQNSSDEYRTETNIKENQRLREDVGTTLKNLRIELLSIKEEEEIKY